VHKTFGKEYKYTVSPRYEFLNVSAESTAIVSPAYGYVSLALVKHSNEGGPGPRYNMKEVPGSPTLIMLVVHAYHPYPLPLFSEEGDQGTSSVGLPPIRATWARPPPAPFKYIPQRCQERPGSVEITLQPLIRGRRP
jgi:hypothetical protein